MSYLNKNRKQIDLAIAFLRSSKCCVYCSLPYSLAFEFEHIFADKDDTKALLACSECNSRKAKKPILHFLRGNADAVAKLLSLLELQFSDAQISDAIIELSKLAISNAIVANKALTLSEVRWICTPNGRLSALPATLKLDLTQTELHKVSRIYNLQECDVYIMPDECE